MTEPASALVSAAARSTVSSLFVQQARLHPDRIAVDDGKRRFSYAELERRSARLARVLAAHGIGAGDRIAILSENRIEYLETFLAAGRIGAIVACQNWRLARPELAHCLALVRPRLLLASPRHAGVLAQILDDPPPALRDGHEVPAPLLFGAGYEALLAAAVPHVALAALDPESALLILYTSGTTGLPKGAVLSHRAEIVRNLVTRAEFGVQPLDTFAAWSPLYHMGGAENALGTLMCGGKVIVVDGFDQARLAQVVADEPLGWLLLMPGMVGPFADALEARGVRANSVRVCGVMADLVPPADIARITRLLGAPYANTFGATETGCPPCSSSLIPIGEAPRRLSKVQSPFCEVRLVDPNDNEVPDGTPGELAMRGPTLFSGYWQAEPTNRTDFRGGWFHMGDVFRRNADGTLDFVDRVKYLIKSGGENVYPAEIERVMFADARVRDVAVVRCADARWGEVPVAFVARHDDSLDAAALRALCREHLAGYKQPKGIAFIGHDEFPRSASGKIQRHELEKRLDTTRFE